MSVSEYVRRVVGGAWAELVGFFKWKPNLWFFITSLAAIGAVSASYLEGGVMDGWNPSAYVTPAAVFLVLGAVLLFVWSAVFKGPYLLLVEQKGLTAKAQTERDAAKGESADLSRRLVERHHNQETAEFLSAQWVEGVDHLLPALKHLKTQQDVEQWREREGDWRARTLDGMRARKCLPQDVNAVRSHGPLQEVQIYPTLKANRFAAALMYRLDRVGEFIKKYEPQ